MTLGELIGVARECKGWTLRELEKASGVSNPLISQIETGKVKDPGFATVVRLVDTLNNQCPAESTSVAEAVEREREACAKIADSEARPTGKPYDPYRAAAEAIAIRIRNRKEGGCAVLDEIRKAKKNDF